MIKTERVASLAVVVGLTVSVGLVGAASIAGAASTSDRGAAIVTLPKVVVDASGGDTLIQVTNNSSSLKRAHCFYVDAIGCTELDFDIVLTPQQPLSWYASEGLQQMDLPLKGPGLCVFPPGRPCFSNVECGGTPPTCNLGPTNIGTGVPPVSSDDYVGTLKCIAYTLDAGNNWIPEAGTQANWMTMNATILSPGSDAQKYNGVGLQAVLSAISGPVLQLGNATQQQQDQLGADATGEYAACPNVLIVNHLFDNAVDPLSLVNGQPPDGNNTVHTDLTLVPCGDDFLHQIPGSATAQFLVFNEFEQRFSTSRTVQCVLNTQISRIDTSNSQRSIFSAGVSGTIAGQTRIRGVGGYPTIGSGLLGVAVFNSARGTAVNNSAAYNIHQQGDSPTANFITVP